MSGGIHSSGENADGVELLVSPTDDMGKILSALHNIPVRGRGDTNISGVDVAASVQVASLALKHRRNKNGQQRIVIFVGSPMAHVDSRALVKVGKMLKKNNVAIDVVALGEMEENEKKLKDLVDAANGNNEEKLCHLVTIPTGVLPSDVLIGSPIVHGGEGGGGGGGGGGMPGGVSGGMDGFAEFGGVDPNMDPELAMALRVSMEEERARQERLARQQQADNAQNEESKDDHNGDGGNGGRTSESNTADMMNDMGDEDALLQQALALSVAASQPNADAAGNGNEDFKPPAETTIMDEDDEDDEDAAMQMALRMSMLDGNPDSSSQQQQIQDPQFFNQLLGSLPGVDQNDPEIRSAFENLNKSNQEKEDDKKDDEDSDKKSDKK